MTQNSQITRSEILRQPQSLQSLKSSLKMIYNTLDQVFENQFDQLIFTGCGTSYYLAQSAAYMFSSLNKEYAMAVPCSELYYNPEIYVKNKNTLVVPITRKSFTTEVRIAIDKVRTLPTVKSLAVTCDKGSAEYNDYMISSDDAEEKSVIMTSSFTSLLLLTYILANFRNCDNMSLNSINLLEVSKDIILKSDTLAKDLSDSFQENLIVCLGQGVYYGVANESMNKIKEMSLSHSESYHSLEYRHGPMSLIDEQSLVIVFSDNNSVDQDIKLIKDLKSKGATCLSVSKNLYGLKEAADYSLCLPEESDDFLNSVFASFFAQLYGYHLSLKKSLNADAPRHLSQAIVIEK